MILFQNLRKSQVGTISTKVFQRYRCRPLYCFKAIFNKALQRYIPCPLIYQQRTERTADSRGPTGWQTAENQQNSRQQRTRRTADSREPAEQQTAENQPNSRQQRTRRTADSREPAEQQTAVDRQDIKQQRTSRILGSREPAEHQAAGDWQVFIAGTFFYAIQKHYLIQNFKCKNNIMQIALVLQRITGPPII